MPPRHTYWTILIDNKPTAFRARDKEELQPTLRQLQRTNANVVMKWFARGRVWDTPEQARWASSHVDTSEKRGRDWRPGGTHEDPRSRFDPRRARSDKRKDARGPDKLPHPARFRDSQSSGGSPTGGPNREARRVRGNSAESNVTLPAPKERRAPSHKSAHTGGRSWSARPPGKGQQRSSNKPLHGGKRPWGGKPPREGHSGTGTGGPTQERPQSWHIKAPRQGQKPWPDDRPGQAQRRPSGKPPHAGLQPWHNEPPRNEQAARRLPEPPRKGQQVHVEGQQVRTRPPGPGPSRGDSNEQQGYRGQRPPTARTPMASADTVGARTGMPQPSPAGDRLSGKATGADRSTEPIPRPPEMSRSARQPIRADDETPETRQPNAAPASALKLPDRDDVGNQD